MHGAGNLCERLIKNHLVSTPEARIQGKQVCQMSYRMMVTGFWYNKAQKIRLNQLNELDENRLVVVDQIVLIQQ